MTPRDKIPPRINHNDQLAREWLSKNKELVAVPPVSKQAPSHAVNPQAIRQYGYNPTIAQFNGQTLIAYRYHEGGSSTKLAMARLNENLSVVDNKPIRLGSGRSEEDPRLFWHQGQLWISWVESRFPKEMTAVVCYGRLVDAGKDWGVEARIQPKVNGNDWSSTQKNWIFFDNDGKLMCLYQSQPEQIVYHMEGEVVMGEHFAYGIQWPWGEVRGGCVPIEHEGKLLRIFHSALDNEPLPYRRRYYIGALMMDKKPPFALCGMTKRPLLTGSELDDMSDTQRASCHHFKPQVVFPGGAVVSADKHILLAVGVNDSSSLIVRFTFEEILARFK